MKKRGIVIVASTLLALSVGSLAFVSSLPLAVTPQFEKTFLGELKEKVNLLDQSEGKRIVIIGGSGVPFSTRSSYIEEAFPSYKAVDFGMYAELGSDVLLQLALPRVHEGDVLIFSPEQHPQTLSSHFDPYLYLQASDGAMHLLNGLTPEQSEKAAKNWLRFGQAKWRYQVSGTTPDPKGIYAKASFDKYGDIASEICAYNTMDGGYDQNQKIVYSLDQWEKGFLDRVNDFALEAKKKGASCYYRFAPANEDAVVGDTLDSYYIELQKKLVFPILGNPHHSLIESGYFFDTNFHLNNAGALLNTKYLIDELKTEWGDPSPTKIEVPEAPEPITPVIEGNNEDVGCFTYVLEGDHYRINGLSEAGKSRPKLILPVIYEGKPITGFEANAFLNATSLEELHIQKNVSSLSDAAFKGLASFRALYLENDDPSSLRVGERLLEGSGASIYVPRQAFSDYATNYFWAIYSDRLVAF